MGKISSPGAAEPRRWIERQLSPRAGSMSTTQSALSLWGWSLHTVRGGIDPGDLCFRPRVVGVDEIRKDFRSRDKTLSSPGAAGPRRWPEGQLSPRAGSMSFIQSATSQWGWGLDILRGGVDPGDLRFRPLIVRVAEIWKDFSYGDETLSSAGVAGP